MPPQFTLTRDTFGYAIELPGGKWFIFAVEAPHFYHQSTRKGGGEAPHLFQIGFAVRGGRLDPQNEGFTVRKLHCVTYNSYGTRSHVVVTLCLL